MKKNKSVDKKAEEAELAEEKMKDENNVDTADEKEDGKVADKKSEAEEWKEKYEDMNDRYLRLYSEFDNYRKRTQKEKLELYKTASEDVMLALLPILDDFERAEKSMGESEDSDGLKQGIDLIYQKLKTTLVQKGLKAMDSPIGEKFDLDTQEAITRIDAPTDDMKGKVIDEVERGYFLNDKVIRFSKVVVGE